MCTCTGHDAPRVFPPPARRGEKRGHHFSMPATGAPGLHRLLQDHGQAPHNADGVIRVPRRGHRPPNSARNAVSSRRSVQRNSMRFKRSPAAALVQVVEDDAADLGSAWGGVRAVPWQPPLAPLAKLKPYFGPAVASCTTQGTAALSPLTASDWPDTLALHIRIPDLDSRCRGRSGTVGVPGSCRGYEAPLRGRRDVRATPW